MGTPGTLGCPNHELSGEFFNWLYRHEVPHGGRSAWFFKIPFTDDHKSPIADWLEHGHDLTYLARTNLKHVRERGLTRRNRTRRPTTFKAGDLVLVHHSRLPTWPCNCLQDPYHLRRHKFISASSTV